MTRSTHKFVLPVVDPCGLVWIGREVRIVTENGKKSLEEAKDYMKMLEKEHRYQRDVWLA